MEPGEPLAERDELSRLIGGIDPGPTPFMLALAAREPWAVAKSKRLKAEAEAYPFEIEELPEDASWCEECRDYHEPW